MSILKPTLLLSIPLILICIFSSTTNSITSKAQELELTYQKNICTEYAKSPKYYTYNHTKYTITGKQDTDNCEGKDESKNEKMFSKEDIQKAYDNHVGGLGYILDTNNLSYDFELNPEISKTQCVPGQLCEPPVVIVLENQEIDFLPYSLNNQIEEIDMTIFEL